MGADATGTMPEDEAQAVHTDPAHIVLNNADRDKFLQMLDSEEGPNEALVQAAQSFNQRYGR